MTVRVRFAPSPTGKMHVGHLRAAVPNAIFAIKHGGSFMVRMEDTDIERNVEEAENAILEDLAWLGLEANESIRHGGDFGPYNTRARAERGDYKDAVQKLLDTGRAYECYVSQPELDLMRKLQRSRNEPPRYDNRHRDLTAEQIADFKAEGREPVIRFKLNDAEITFQDMVRGDVKFDPSNLGGDPVIVRSNGIPLFTLAGVVDDINMEISHVVRGEDHVANTAIQVQIFEALGAALPNFAHIPLLLDAEGQKFSKRLGSLTVENLRDKGYLPHAVVAYMMSLGTGISPEVMSLEELAGKFDFAKTSRAAPRFDEDQLVRVNATYIHSLSLADAKPYLMRFVDGETLSSAQFESFWNTSRANMTLLSDVKTQYDMIYGDIPAASLEAEDQSFIEVAAAELPAGPYNAETWGAWVGEIKSKTGRKGKALFMPLRLALTGQQHGPELADLLPLIGEDLARARLTAATKS